MKRIFIDTNILIDFLARRGEFFIPAWSVISLSKQGDQILVSALSFATASYVLETHHKKSPEAIKTLIGDFVKISCITPIDSQTIDESIVSGFSDFEDAMQYFSALRESADLIITRNKDDYKAALIPVYEPQEYLDLLTKCHNVFHKG